MLRIVYYLPAYDYALFLPASNFFNYPSLAARSTFPSTSLPTPRRTPLSSAPPLCLPGGAHRPSAYPEAHTAKRGAGNGNGVKGSE